MKKTRKTLVSLILAVALILGLSTMFASATAEETGAIIIPMECSSVDWIRSDDKEAIKLINALLEEDVPVHWALKDFEVGGKTYPAGTFYIPTPFTTKGGLDQDTVYDWLQWEGKKHHVYTITTTKQTINVESKELVLPRVILFYDQSTFDNALEHYNTMTNLGFKVRLATAEEITAYDWDDPNSVFATANVFAMPGGSMHFYSFMDYQKGIDNIRGFIENGGGYVSVCAGSSEALANTSYPDLMLINAGYLEDWFVYDSMTEGDWDWRTLIGPIYLNIENSDHPVMFGYGKDALRPGYGDLTTMYYYGGPAIVNAGEEVEILATYDSPVTQKATEKVSNIWGTGAVVTQSYGEGEVVSFGPHPEWPGPGKRMYAQALYFTAKNEVDTALKPMGTAPEKLDGARVDAIVDTAQEIKPILESLTRTASEIVNLRVGDHYHPLGLWRDEVIQAYGMQMYDHINEIQAAALNFQFQFDRLTALKATLPEGPAKEHVQHALDMINTFFTYSETLGNYVDPRFIDVTDWTGCGPFAPYGEEYDIHTFADLTKSFEYLETEVVDYQLPMAKDYLVILNQYEELRIENERNHTEETQAALDALHLEITASWETIGPLYKGMYGLEHTLTIMQYKVDNHLLNLMTIAHQAEEAISLANYVAAEQTGSWAYAMKTIKAFFANPIGGVL